MSILDIATKAADYATGGVVSKLLESGQDDRQNEQQKRLTRTQIDGAKEMSDYNYQQQKRLWLETGIGGQMEEALKAGINPNAIFGKGGQAGQTGSGGPMPTGAQAADPNAGVRNMLDVSMQRAQTKLLEAQATKASVEADKLAGADTEATKAAAGLAGSQTELNKIRAQLEGKSLEDQLDIIAQQKYMAMDEASIKQDQRQISNETVRTQINTANQELTNLAIEAVAKQQNIALDKARIAEISQDINRKWQELSQQTTKSRYEHEDRLTAIKEYTSNALKTAGIIAAGNVIGDVVKIATRQVPQVRKGHSTERVNTEGESSYEYTQYH